MLLDLNKPFKKVKEGEFIYYINPFIAVREMHTPLDVLMLPSFAGWDQFIQGVKVKEVRGLPDEPAYRTWVEIEYYRSEHIVHSPDISKIPTVTLRFNGERNFALTMVNLEGKDHKYPVPYCTSREFLMEYIKSTRGQKLKL